jgi:hypothetical protein
LSGNEESLDPNTMIIAEEELKTHSLPNDEVNENFTNVSIADASEVNTIDTQHLSSNDLHDADYNGNNFGSESADNIHNANGNGQSNPAEEFNEGKDSRKRDLLVDDATPFDESTTFDENINETDDVNAGDFSGEKRVKRG